MCVQIFSHNSITNNTRYVNLFRSLLTMFFLYKEGREKKTQLLILILCD